MSADGEYFYNEVVEVGKTLKIAARGLTPNHVHFPTQVSAQGCTGVLTGFTHWQKATRIKLQDVHNHLWDIWVQPLEVIEVTAL